MTQTKEINQTSLFTFVCLCPLRLVAKLNFDTSKGAYGKVACVNFIQQQLADMSSAITLILIFVRLL